MSTRSLPPARPAQSARAWSFTGLTPAVAAALLFTASAALAQTPRAKRHPLTAYLDLRPAPPGSAAQSAPSWVEAFEFVPAVSPELVSSPQPTVEVNPTPAPAQGLNPNRSYFRVRLQPPPGASDHLQMRVFFDDAAAGPRPRVTVWNGLGEKVTPSQAIGQGLDLPSSETLNVYMNGVNYVEIEAPGDGARVRGLFLSWLEAVQVFQPSDFHSTEATRQPFGILPAARTPRTDAYYHGVVTARLQGSKPLVLKPGAPAAAYEFSLEHAPLLAVVSFEVLGASLDAAPAVAVNGRARGGAEFYLPDLADPAFRGQAREAEPGMNFRYAGWVHAQKVIPGTMLAAGLNNLGLALSDNSQPLAVRSVSIQLKYGWDKLDYDLTPALPPDANP